MVRLLTLCVLFQIVGCGGSDSPAVSLSDSDKAAVTSFEAFVKHVEEKPPVRVLFLC